MPPPQPQQEPTFPQKMQMMEDLMVFPALSVCVFLRKNLGYRILNPNHLFGVALFLFVIGGLAINTPNHEALMLFALLVPFFGLAQKFRRWIDQRRGRIIHSYYIGDSIFEFAWYPKFILRNRRFTRFFDCFLCIFGGIALVEFSRPLGFWLLISGFALRAIEASVKRRSQNRDLDTVDGMIASEVHAQTVEDYIERPQAIRNQDASDEGIATGISPDIERKIRQRKQRDKPRRN